MRRFDAIVVGAGPAGSTAARELAAAGSRVALVDAAEFPRYKACGGGIPLRAERLLPFPIASVVEDSVSRLEVAYRGRHQFHRSSGQPFAHMAMRDRFDGLLVEHARRAGAEFLPATRVRSLVLNGAGATITDGSGLALEADFVVAADGANSPVGAMAGLGEGLAECAAWEVEVRGTRADLQRYRGSAIIELGFRPWGYAWVFPKQSLLSIGIVTPREQARLMKRRAERFIGQLGLGSATVDIARGHKIRFRRGGEPIARGNVLLAGDAAGLADEFTQEGISYAIHSGRLAARAVLAAMGGGGRLEPYQAAVDAEILPELRAARLIARMFYGALRRWPHAWMSASARTGFLWSAFFAVQRGESTYAQELRRIPFLDSLAGHRGG